MKIFDHDGKIINLETVSSIEKHQDPFCHSEKFYLSFKFIGKNDRLDTIKTSSFSEEIIDKWLGEISITMRKNS